MTHITDLKHIKFLYNFRRKSCKNVNREAA